MSDQGYINHRWPPDEHQFHFVHLNQYKQLYNEGGEYRGSTERGSVAQDEDQDSGLTDFSLSTPSLQFIVLSVLVAAIAAAPRGYDVQESQYYKQQKQQQQVAQVHDYEQPQRHGSYGSGSEGKFIPIVKFEAEQTPTAYKYGFEGANGIQMIEQGQVKNAGQKDEANVAEGFYAYKGDDGREYSVQYVADENGFRAVGDHLPTPVPLPEENQRLLAEAYARPTSKYDEEEYEQEEKASRYQQQQHQQQGQRYQAQNH